MALVELDRHDLKRILSAELQKLSKRTEIATYMSCSRMCSCLGNDSGTKYAREKTVMVGQVERNPCRNYYQNVYRSANDYFEWWDL